MKFSEAEARLAEIARGEYRFIQYHKTITDRGHVETECQIYIHGGDVHKGRTWEEAFKNREENLNPSLKPIEETPDEIPEAMEA